MDYIQIMIKSIIDMVAAALGKERENKNVMFIEVTDSYDIDMGLDITLTSLVKKQLFCEAEDLLFEELGNGFTNGKYNAGVRFYGLLRTIDGSTLKANNFSLEEASDGAAELEKMKRKQI